LSARCREFFRVLHITGKNPGTGKELGRCFFSGLTPDNVNDLGTCLLQYPGNGTGNRLPVGKTKDNYFFPSELQKVHFFTVFLNLSEDLHL
jgi:hypothetical protein